jgi:hypothetical protein
LIALEDQAVVFDVSATPKRRLERFHPPLELRAGQAEVVDNRHLFPTAAGALEANDRAGNGSPG